MADGILGDIAQTLGGAIRDSGAGANISPAELQSLSEALQEIEVQVAGLSEDAGAQVMEALQDLEISDLNDAPEQIQEIVDDAEIASEAREDAADLELQRDEAIESGDFGKAEELAGQAEYEYQTADEHGRQSDVEIVEAQYDAMDLDNADWDQDIATEAAVAADSYAEAGDFDTAAIYADTAADHVDASVDSAASAYDGGAYSSTSAVDTSADVSADTTSE